MLLDDAFEQLKQLDKLPSPPGVAVRVLELVRSEDITISEVADVLSGDPTLSAKLLRYCNSPLLGCTQQISSLPQAIMTLGLRGVKMLSLSFSLVTIDRIANGFDYDGFWSRSLASAVSARALATRLRYVPEEAFISGLMCSIGQLVLATGLSDEYKKVTKLTQAGTKLLDAEKEVFDFNHLEVSSRLLNEWNFPDPLCEAILEFAVDENVTGDLQKLLLASTKISHVVAGRSKDPQTITEIVPMLKESFGIEEDEWGRIFDAIGTQWNEHGQILSIPTCDLEQFAELESQAREHLTVLGLSADVESQAMRKEKEELQIQATTDKLTGVLNRASFDAQFHAESERARRTRGSLGLILIDIDHFKNVNDKYGHKAGDAVLVHIAQRLAEQTRKYDRLCRYGGEEFAVIAPECSLEGAINLADRLRTAVECAAVEFDCLNLKVTISVGVSHAQYPANAACHETLFSRADEQLYEAKRTGRNRVCIATGTNEVSLLH